MSLSFLTGSESLRDIEILNNWLTFEAISDERFTMSGGIYSVALGQDTPSNFTFNTGSLERNGDYITIEKTKHTFDSEDEAQMFLNEIGIENIVTYYESQSYDIRNNITTRLFNIEVINISNFDISTNFFLLQENKGFRIEVLKELTNSTQNIVLERLGRDFEEDSHHGILTEPFLLYFDLENNDV